MPFFFIVPVWLFCIGIGLVLLFFRRRRRMGLYVIGISTAAILVSILVSSMVLYLGIKVGAHVNSKWVGLALIGMYVLGIGFGIVLGAITGFFLTRRLANRLSW